MKERKGLWLRYQASRVEISRIMEIWTLVVFIGFGLQGPLLVSKDTVTSEQLDVSLPTKNLNLLLIGNAMKNVCVS